MAKIDLTSPEWCELIFQGKNKAYGAYKMRANSPKRHTWAMVIVVIIAAIGFSIPTLVKLATPKQKEVMTEVTTLSQLIDFLGSPNGDTTDLFSPTENKNSQRLFS